MLFLFLNACFAEINNLPVYQTYQLTRTIETLSEIHDIYFLVLYKMSYSDLPNISKAFRRLINAIPLSNINPELGIVIDPEIEHNSVLYVPRGSKKLTYVDFQYVKMIKSFHKSEHLNWHIHKDYDIILNVARGKIQPPNPKFDMLSAMKRLTYIKNHNRGDLIRQAIRLQEDIDSAVPPPANREHLPVFADIDPNNGKNLPLDNFVAPEQESNSENEGIVGSISNLFKYFRNKIDEILYHNNKNDDGLDEDDAKNDDINEVASKNKNKKEGENDYDDDDFAFYSDDDDYDTDDENDEDDNEYGLSIPEGDDDPVTSKENVEKRRNDDDDDHKKSYKKKDNRDEEDEKESRKKSTKRRNNDDEPKKRRCK